MKKVYSVSIILIGMIFMFLSIHLDSKHSRSTNYLEAPVPYEVQKHFKRKIKWDKWRQEAWLRGDIIIDSNSVGQKWLFIKHKKKIKF